MRSNYFHMKRFSIYTTLSLILLCGCVDKQPSASIDDLYIGGIYNHQLILDGAEGVSSTFTVKAKHDWTIIDYKGFSCTPSSGEKNFDGVATTVTATPLKANNTADTIRLSDLNFKLLATRFVGISVLQMPQIRFPKGNIVRIDALNGSTTKATIMSQCEDIELVVSGNITASLGEANSKFERTITITTTSDNNTTSEQVIGTIGFKANGVTQGGKMEVVQISALSFDRSVVMLPSRAGVGNTLRINSKFDVEVSNTSQLFSVTRESGTSFTVTATADNTTDAERSLGSVNVILKDYPDCGISIDVVQRPNKAPQTIVAYFIGTALQSFFKNNVAKILEALEKDIQGRSQILVIATESTSDATLYELRYDKILGKAVQEEVKELTLTTPYNAGLFERNLREALKFAPADKYALLVGSHALGWIPKGYIPSTFSTLQRLGFDPSKLWQRDKNAEITRHLGDSEPTRYDVSEIASAIEANNVKFDYILFDACFMGNIESAYELRNSAKYIVGSPCEVMGAGFPYDEVTPYMLTEGGKSYDLDKICSKYVDYYRTSAATPSACIAVTHTDELDALASAMKAVNGAKIRNDFSLSRVQYYEGQNPHTFYDLGDMVEQSCDDSAVAEKFKTQLDKTVTSRYHTDRFYSAYGGNNIYYHDIYYYSGTTTSAMVEHYSTAWKETAWYKATH